MESPSEVPVMIPHVSQASAQEHGTLINDCRAKVARFEKFPALPSMSGLVPIKQTATAVRPNKKTPFPRFLFFRIDEPRLSEPKWT